MHLYVHVPFCGRRCSYCDFAIAVRRTTPDRDFLAAIRAELAQWQGRPESPPSRPLATLYFGGGTPSRLAPETIGEIVGLVNSVYPLDRDAEITLEANPDDVSLARARAWAGAGVNRVSLGVQSHDPAVLAWMHRTHRADQVAPAVAALREAGIRNLSLDLIFALPDEIARDWSRDLHESVALEPEHLSVYGLTTEPRTPLARWTARGSVRATPEERYAGEFLLADRVLTAAGFRHYEVSNYGREGRRSRHNAAYWEGAEYLGLGPSAHAFAGGVRSWNLREWAAYAAALAAGERAREGEERPGPEGRRLEQRYLGLRTDRGVPAESIPAVQRHQWIGAGWALPAGDAVRLTPEGWLRLDALVAAVGLP